MFLRKKNLTNLAFRNKVVFAVIILSILLFFIVINIDIPSPGSIKEYEIDISKFI